MALCNVWYPSETHHKLKSRRVSFAHNVFGRCTIVLKFRTDHDRNADRYFLLHNPPFPSMVGRCVSVKMVRYKIYMCLSFYHILCTNIKIYILLCLRLPPKPGFSLPSSHSISCETEFAGYNFQEGNATWRWRLLWGLHDIGNPSETHLKTTSREISFVINMCLNCAIVLRLWTEHDSDTVVFWAKFQEVWIIETDVMGDIYFARFELKMSFGLISDNAQQPRLGPKILQNVVAKIC